MVFLSIARSLDIFEEDIQRGGSGMHVKNDFSKMTSQARALFATNSEREICELVLHLLTIRLGVTCSRCHRWSSLLRDMFQAHGHLFQGEARRAQAMAEVVPQVMERDVGDVLPLL